MSDAIERLLAKLSSVKRSGEGWTARCPAHDDSNPSLSVARGDDGRALVKCHAGCTVNAICGALGISVAELFPESERSAASPKEHRKTTSYATAADAVAALERSLGERHVSWTYHNGDGQLVGIVVRWDTPEGKQIRPVSRTDDGWVIRGMPPPRPLYRLPELTEADRVFITEGEKAADAARSLGLTATTSAGGSKAAHQTDWRPLAGKDCVMLPDCDEAGERYADAVTEHLLKVDPRPTVRVVNLPGMNTGEDIVEFLDARDSRDTEDIVAEIECLVEGTEGRRVAPPTSGPRPILVPVSSVEAKPVQWLWQDYFPLGKLAVIAGDPGLGKSLITVDLVARVTSGRRMPDGSNAFAPPSPAIFLTAEDAIADTIRPRLEAADAEINLVHVLDGIDMPGQQHAASFTLRDHIEQLRSAIEQTGARLVLIDPLNAHLGGVDAHRDADIRGVLKPLSDLAETLDVAVVVVCHLNKSGSGKAIYRVMGSLGSVAAARIAFAVIEHPDDNQRRVMALIKTNLADTVPSLGYTVHGHQVGDIESVPAIKWEMEPVDLTADQLMSMGASGTSDAEADRQDCQLWLSELLETHGPMTAKDVVKEAQGMWSKTQLRRAHRKLHGTKRKYGYSPSRWFWGLPGQEWPDLSHEIKAEPTDDTTSKVEVDLLEGTEGDEGGRLL